MINLKSVGVSVAIAAFFTLIFYSYSMYRDNKAGELREQSLTAKLGVSTMLISVQTYIDESNRAISASQLANEKRLRDESDSSLQRLRQAAKNNRCAGERMPDSIISILRE